MKTYLLNAVKRLKNYSQKLDAEAILFEKSWEVFNESGNKELMIFRINNELLISRNGIVQRGKWELLDIANLIIDAGEKTYLFNAAYIEDKFLALKLDGTNEFMVMIEADMKNRFALDSVKSIESYLDDRYKRIEEKKEAEKKVQKRLEAKIANLEAKRIQQEEKRVRIQEEEIVRIQEEKRVRIREERKLERIREQQLFYDLQQKAPRLTRNISSYKFVFISSLLISIASLLIAIIILADENMWGLLFLGCFVGFLIRSKKFQSLYIKAVEDFELYEKLKKIYK